MDDMTMEEIAAAARKIDPQGVAEAFKQKLIADKGEWWARKVATLSGIKSCIIILSKIDGIAAEVVQSSLTRLAATDALLDLKEKYPDRDIGELVVEMSADATAMLGLAHDLAGTHMNGLGSQRH